MTLNELLEKLTKAKNMYGGDIEVRCSSPSGDYWRTVLAQPIRGMGLESVTESNYHGCDKVVASDSANTDGTPIRTILLLK